MDLKLARGINENEWKFRVLARDEKKTSALVEAVEIMYEAQKRDVLLLQARVSMLEAK